MEESFEGARLHTAEHMFARALQEQGLKIHVRKADTYREDNIGKVYIKEIIPFDSIKKAEATVNDKIIDDLMVMEETFKTIDEAKKKIPKLRFNEERLEGRQEIRVVNIGEYDFSACGHLHAKSTKEIISFAVNRVSYLGGETEIEFLAGTRAIEFLLKMKNTVLETAMKHHFIPEELELHAEKQRESINEMESEEKRMLSAMISNSNNIIELKNAKISKFYGELSSITRKHPEKCIALTNGSQIIVLKGKDSAVDIVAIGEKLRRKGFSGSINESTINGKADETIIEELKKEWKV
jgi:alanyl-tRNA synthetase